MNQLLRSELDAMFPSGPRLLQKQCGTETLRIADVPLNVPFRCGWEWISLDVSGSRLAKKPQFLQ